MKRRARRRLVGAIALVVFVVIALPIVLDSEPKPTSSQDLTIQIPSQDAGKFATRVLPAQPEPVPAPTTSSTPAVTPSALTPVPAPAPEAAAKALVVPEAPKAAVAPAVAPSVKPAPAITPPVAPAAAPVSTAATSVAKTETPAKDAPMAVTATAKEATTPAAASAAKPAAVSVVPAVPAAEAKSPGVTDRGFIVPLGLYSKADNIKQVRAKATAAGFKTYTEAIAGSASVRVRAGPFVSRDAADKAREKLKGAGLDVGAVAAR